MKNKLFLTLLAALGMAASQNSNATTFANVSFLGGSAQNTVNGRSYTTITTDQRWTRDKVYILDRITFIASGCTVTIEPGTLVRGEVYTVVGDTTDPTKPPAFSGKVAGLSTFSARKVKPFPLAKGSTRPETATTGCWAVTAPQRR